VILKQTNQFHVRALSRKGRIVMPGLDGTGPRGKGPMTGAGEGYCMLVVNDSKKELDNLKSQANNLQTQLSRIKNRIKALEKLAADK
jgi:phage tail tape-measure protein